MLEAKEHNAFVVILWFACPTGFFAAKGCEFNVIHVDVLGPMLDALPKWQNSPSVGTRAFCKACMMFIFAVGAIEFAVKYDDGNDPGAFFMQMWSPYRRFPGLPNSSLYVSGT
jgi:regulator of PEP synthase PpsR (kinase-PPPase family)